MASSPVIVYISPGRFAVHFTQGDISALPAFSSEIRQHGSNTSCMVNGIATVEIYDQVFLDGAMFSDEIEGAKEESNVSTIFEVLFSSSFN